MADGFLRCRRVDRRERPRNFNEFLARLSAERRDQPGPTRHQSDGLLVSVERDHVRFVPALRSRALGRAAGGRYWTKPERFAPRDELRRGRRACPQLPDDVIRMQSSPLQFEHRDPTAPMLTFGNQEVVAACLVRRRRRSRACRNRRPAAGRARRSSRPCTRPLLKPPFTRLFRLILPRTLSSSVVTRRPRCDLRCRPTRCAARLRLHRSRRDTGQRRQDGFP